MMTNRGDNARCHSERSEEYPSSCTPGTGPGRGSLASLPPEARQIACAVPDRSVRTPARVVPFLKTHDGLSAEEDVPVGFNSKAGWADEHLAQRRAVLAVTVDR